MWHQLGAHLRGHALLFDKKSASTIKGSAGVYMLLIVAALEALRLALLRWLQLFVPLLLLIPGFIGLALLSVRFGAGLRPSAIGFPSWREWSATEKSYFIQVLILANVIFPVIFAARLRTILAEPSLMRTVWAIFVPYLFFGFYQELVYRGFLQTELVRRWGALSGILLSNVLYTFGPLHWNYFLSPASSAVPMFAAIFAIGLFFGVLFRRSSNLWIVAIMHGIGNSYIVGSLGNP